MSKLIYYTFNNMYCIVAFYVRFIKACMNPRKKAETSKQICKTDQYLGFSGNRPSQCWILAALCGVEHGFKANPDSIPPPPAAWATLRLECVHHRGGGECHGGGDRGCPGQQVRAGSDQGPEPGLTCHSSLQAAVPAAGQEAPCPGPRPGPPRPRSPPPRG